MGDFGCKYCIGRRKVGSLCPKYKKKLVPDRIGSGGDVYYISVTRFLGFTVGFQVSMEGSQLQEGLEEQLL